MRQPLMVFTLLGSTLIVVASAQSPSPVDYQVLAKIREEGLVRSQVMDHIGTLSDVYGARLTGSPAMRHASDWAMKKFTEWGLTNVRREEWSFGKGWSLVRFSAHLTEPSVQPLIGYPKAWSAGTAGSVTGEVVRVDIDSEDDFARYTGKLAGRMVLLQPSRPLPMLEGPVVLRMSDADVREAERMPVPPVASPRPDTAAFRKKLADFLLAEKALAVLDRGSDDVMVAGGSELSWKTQRVDGGTIFVGVGGTRDEGAGRNVPSAVIAVEQYNRLVRLVERGVRTTVQIDIETRFHKEVEPNGFNTFAELQGTDPRGEVVFLGAHLDSTHAAAGATDNATGSGAVMEALRILVAAGVKPRRTIRAALWGGEEQGLLGSRAYVKAHLADPEGMQPKAGNDKLALYLNSDNGTGRVRGVWLQGNLGAAPLFERWFAPLRDLGVTVLGSRSVTSTDHHRVRRWRRSRASATARISGVTIASTRT
ncbi:MAG: M20/M25/M40 family metallo-hydrolase [Acidobacteria bacterium]|nr:M20/M25/M40 family metallo-hydrolase [Acidobacteriota bacterium]